jgi:hypothetical protein
VFHRVLRRAIARCGQPLAISMKTRLADIVRCPPRLWETAYGRRLSQKHVDFVLYDSFSTRIVAAIELDDRSHDRPERQRRDSFVDSVFAAVRIPLIRVRAAAEYDADAIATLIAGAQQFSFGSASTQGAGALRSSSRRNSTARRTRRSGKR